ncbi:FkbM family methyltransferase [Aerosakkonemataceae cyanobacterium BLCC-F50]|uniref:FkbM family methyltransferase n=1 Tax=Floridaenema flaviceps BLCC-F50 TaxID=3153642 RepID=A0ABV4Y366_9CYAN
MDTISLPFGLPWLQPFDFPYKLGICDRIFGKAIVNQRICWVQTAAGIPWKLDLANPVHRWIVYGKYEGPEFINWAREFLPPDGVIVDSGANIGQILLYLSQFVPQGKVLAFEPGKEQADWLAECLAVNSTLPVELIRCGLGATTTQLKLRTHGPEYIHGYWCEVSETEGEPIQIVRLADELEKRAIEKVDLWKLDVEGYEIPALEGAKELIKQKRIRVIYAELMKENGQRIREYLANFGYKCYLFKSNGKLYIPDELPIYTNGLFVP